jgi:hypothetical protein
MGRTRFGRRRPAGSVTERRQLTEAWNLNNLARHAFAIHRYTGELQMLKFLGGTVGVIFLIGLLVVIGLLMLIF